MHQRVPTGIYTGEVVDIFFGNESQCQAGPLATDPCISTQAHALQRTRSAGMMRPRNSRTGAYNAPYYASSDQYRYSRNRTIAQNRTTLLQMGNPDLTPGAPGSYDHVYASGTATSCPGQPLGDNVGNASTYYPVYHHPSNPQFDTQGAVDASARLYRLKYDTVTNSGPPVETPYGTIVPSALAMALGGDTYRLKDRVGAPYPCSPFVPAVGPATCLPLARNPGMRH